LNKKKLLYEYLDKTVLLTCTNGKQFNGTVSEYTSAQDNEPDPESICIGCIEFYNTDIASIEVLD
jgi:hypothetical protein